MKKQLITSLVLVLGLTSIAQPSFAMKRNRPGNTADQVSSMISTLVIAVKWFLANELGPNHVTFVSQSGTHFNVVANDLDAFLHLSPSIATLLFDLVGTDISIMPLPNVHNSALYVLTEMAGGADHVGLLDYIRSLSDSDIEELKKDAELLDSNALKDLISNALDNPFTWLPPEVLPLMLEKVGPKGRSSCASVDKTLKGAVTIVRKPVAEGGLGCTDTLPIVATINLGCSFVPEPPVVHGQMVYMTCASTKKIQVIDTKTNQLIATIAVGGSPLQPIVHGQMLYVANFGDNTVSVIDTNTNRVVATITVGRSPRALVVHDQMIRVLTFDGVAVIDTNTNEVVETLPANNWISAPVGNGQMHYVANEAYGTVSVIDTKTNQVVATIKVGCCPVTPLIYGQMVYVANFEDGTVSVIDINTNKVVATVEAGIRPIEPVAYGQMLYVLNVQDTTVSVIDINTNQVLATIAFNGLNPRRLTVHGGFLYLELGEEVYVIDIGGYLPGQH